MIPLEDREDEAITQEERFGDIDFRELGQSSGNPNYKTYPISKKVEAAVAFFNCGNTKRAAKDVGIPWNLLSAWRFKSPWWDEVQLKLKTEKQAELDASITNYLHEAQDAALDRLKNGDYRLTPSGELKRVPMSGKDIALTSATFFDRRALLRGDATSIQRKQDPLRDIKGKLEAFAQYSKATEIDGTKKKKTGADVTRMINNARERDREG